MSVVEQFNRIWDNVAEAENKSDPQGIMRCGLYKDVVDGVKTIFLDWDAETVTLHIEPIGPAEKKGINVVVGMQAAGLLRHVHFGRGHALDYFEWLSTLSDDKTNPAVAEQLANVQKNKPLLLNAGPDYSVIFAVNNRLVNRIMFSGISALDRGVVELVLFHRFAGWRKLHTEDGPYAEYAKALRELYAAIGLTVPLEWIKS